ncbi:Hypothetical predicted protein [Paramuricea clavata]|uniref:Uncharacterized protein n=1 Tax=Paramuricea clavata TaxID=317549 RepID=A0A6S7H9H1_PARCT|nr:Hypothetical predicted protein [Paramuricea clavata]
MEEYWWNNIWQADANETENKGVQDYGKTGDPIWHRDLGSEKRTSEEIGGSGEAPTDAATSTQPPTQSVSTEGPTNAMSTQGSTDVLTTESLTSTTGIETPTAVLSTQAPIEAVSRQSLTYAVITQVPTDVSATTETPTSLSGIGGIYHQLHWVMKDSKYVSEVFIAGRRKYTIKNDSFNPVQFMANNPSDQPVFVNNVPFSKFLEQLNEKLRK